MLATGCGSGTPESDGTPKSAETADSAGGLSGELTFANWQWLETGRGDAIWDAVTQYEAVNDGVTMKQLAVPYKDYPGTMKAQMGAQGGPDILILTDVNYAEMAAAGLLEPLDGVLPSELEANLNATNEGAIYEGTRYGYAWEVVNYALIWNKALLAEAGVEPPTDMQSFVDAAVAVTEATGNPGFAARHQMNEEAAWWEDFSNWPYGFGGGWSEDGKLTIDTEENIAAVQAFKDMYDSGAMAIGDDASTFRTKFAEGKIGMLIDNSSVALTVTTDNPVLSGDDIGTSALPFPTPNATHSVMYLAVNAYSENKELAEDWLRWFYTQDAQEAVAAGLAPSSIGTNAAMPAEFLSANPWVDTYTAQAEFTRSSAIKGFEEQFPEISHIVMGEIEKVLVSDADPSEALAKAQADAEAIANS